MPTLSRLPLLQIRSEDNDVVRKGRLLQWLVLLLTGMSLVRFLLDLPLALAETPANALPYFFQLLGTLLFAAICLFFIHKGRVIEAAHLFAIILITTFFLLLLTQFPGEIGLPYLMLIPVMVIAVLDKVRASMVYALIIVSVMGLFTAVTPTYTWLNFAFFALVVMGTSLTTWLLVSDLQRAIQHTGQLAQESRQKTELLQLRAQQLHNSAQMAQRTGLSTHLNEFLPETARLIRETFRFYHVSIMLLEENGQWLRLSAVAGQEQLLQTGQPYRLPVDEQSIMGWTAVHQTARISEDVTADPYYLAEPLLPETRSEMALPLVARDRLLGVLDVQSRRSHAFQEEDVAFLQIAANQLAASIDNARLLAQAESNLKETQVLHQFNTLLVSSLDIGEIYRRAARAIAQELAACRCLMLTWQPDQSSVTVQVGYEQSRLPGAKAGFFWDTAVYHFQDYPSIEEPIRSGNTAVYRLDPQDKAPEQRILTTYRAAHWLAAPMKGGVKGSGLIWIFRDHDQPPFQPAEIQLAQAMAGQMAVALTNAYLTSDAQVRVAQLSTINRMSVILSHAPSLKAIFDGARREIMALIPATGMSIMLLAKDGEHINWLYGFEYGHEVDLSGVPPLPITQGFSGHVVRTREMLYVDKDDTELRHKLQTVVVGEDLAAWLGLPMIVSGALVGVLAVENEDSFSEPEIELLKTIVGPLASAIHNFIQLDELQAALEAQSQQRIQLQTAAEVAAAATGVLNLEEVVEASVNLIKERFGLYYVGLFLVDYDKKEAVLVSGTDEAGRLQVQENRRLRVGGQSLIGGATADGKPRITQDVSQDVEWLPNPYLPDTRSELALPLQAHGRVIGALTAQSTQPHHFTPPLIRVLQTLCDQLATAVENARLLARVEARAHRQQTLAQLSAQLHQTADIEEIVAIGLRAISRHLDNAPVLLQLGKQSGANGGVQESEPPASNAQTGEAIYHE
jgi:GAF domain-containing protein